MRHLRLVLLVLLLAAAPRPPGLLAQVVQGIVAVVNDDIVTTQQLDERLRLALATSGLPDDVETRRRVRTQVLRGIIDETLERQEARRLDLAATPADVDRAVKQIADANRMSPAGLEDYLRAHGIDPQAMRNQITAQIAWLKVIDRQVRPKVVVTEEQVDIAMRSAAAGAGAGQLLVSEILLPVESASQEPDVLKDATELVKAIRAGAAFGPLARQVSVAASADQGGDLGWIQTSSLVDELRDVLVQLPPGAVSDPIRSPDGIYIFQVRGRRGAVPAARALPVNAPPPASGASDRASGPDLAAAGSVSLAQIFFPLPQGATAAQVEAAMRQAATVQTRLGDCSDVERVAADLHAEQSGALGRLRVQDLPKALADVVARLPTGQASDPVRGPSGVHLLMVCDRDRPPQTASAEPPPEPLPAPELAAPAAPSGLETRDQVRARLVEEQTQRLANRYLRDLRRNAFIDLRS